MDGYSLLRITIREATNRQRFVWKGIVQEGVVWEADVWVGIVRGEMSGLGFFWMVNVRGGAARGTTVLVGQLSGVKFTNNRNIHNRTWTSVISPHHVVLWNIFSLVRHRTVRCEIETHTTEYWKTLTALITIPSCHCNVRNRDTHNRTWTLITGPSQYCKVCNKNTHNRTWTIVITPIAQFLTLFPINFPSILSELVLMFHIYFLFTSASRLICDFSVQTSKLPT